MTTTESADRPRLPLPPRTSSDTTGEVQKVLTTLEQIGSPKLILRTLANSDTAFPQFVRLTGGLLRSQYLPRPVQEVVILHMAVRRDSHYELLEHLEMARSAGVAETKLDAIQRDVGAVDDSVFDDADLLAVRLADGLLEERRIDPDVWKQVVDAWGEAGGVDLILSVATWGAMVPTLVEALGLRELSD